MLYSYECKMTEEERHYLAPIFNRIDSGYKRFKICLVSGDVVIVEFNEYHEAYYDDDIFEIDFTVEKVIKNVTGTYEKGDMLCVSLDNYIDTFEALG